MQQMQRQVPLSRQRPGVSRRQTHKSNSSSAARQSRKTTSSSGGGNLLGPGQAPPRDGRIAPNNLARPGNVDGASGLSPTSFGPSGAIDLPTSGYPFQQPAGLAGQSTVRVMNPTKNDAHVELRSQNRAEKSSFRVPAGGSNEITVPNGSYQAFFRFSHEPEAILQGENLRLSNQILAISLKAVPNGNYALRRVD
jgi:hypothetical protein